MSEKKSMLGWNNMQSSIGFNFDQQDSNSRCFLRFKEESISLAPKLFANQQQSCQPFYNPFLVDNTINFYDIHQQAPPILKLQAQQASKQFNKQSQSDSDEQAGHHHLSKKGLRHLAHLLLNTLRKKNLYSHREVAQEIEKHLIQKSQRGKDSLRIQKNIRRRIYDALNVMISAGLLQRQMTQIKLASTSCLLERNYSVVNKKKQYNNKMIEIQKRVILKKQFLRQIISKRDALKFWFNRNSGEKYSKNRLSFPLVFIIKQSKEIIFLQLQRYMVNIRNSNILIFSETDLIEYAYKVNMKSQQTEIYFEEITV